MIGLLKLAGLCMAIYGIYGVYTGEIYSRSGMTSKVLYKEEPISFWVACCSYIFIGTLIFLQLYLNMDKNTI